MVVHKYLEIVFFNDKIEIFKHFSRKIHNIQGKIKKNSALFKHFTKIQALFNVCSRCTLIVPQGNSVSPVGHDMLSPVDMLGIILYNAE